MVWVVCAVGDVEAAGNATVVAFTGKKKNRNRKGRGGRATLGVVEAAAPEAAMGRSSSRSTFTATEVEFDGLNSSSCRWWLWLGLQVECKAEHSEGNALHQRAHVGAIHTVASDGH